MKKNDWPQLKKVLQKIMSTLDREEFLSILTVEEKEQIKLFSEVIDSLYSIELERGPGRFIDLEEAQKMRRNYIDKSVFFPEFMKFIALQVGRDHLEELLKFVDEAGAPATLFQIMPGLGDDNNFRLMTVAMTATNKFIFPKKMRTIPEDSAIDGDVSDDYRPCPPAHCDDIV